MVTQTVQRSIAQMIHTVNNGLGKNSTFFHGGIPRILDIPSNLVTALDVNGSLLSRNQSDDLQVVLAFRQMISRQAKEAGAKVTMVSAALTRELQWVASLLHLGNQPAVAEMGHVIMPAVLDALSQLVERISLQEIWQAA